MGIPLFQVDAFTAKAFSGNPAAVCLLEEEAEVEWMQSVATEMNLSETVFLVPQNDGFGLRWFTPTTEVDLCGHATLASAHVLWGKGQLAENKAARFHTRSGLLTAKLRDDWIELDFPSTPADPIEPPAGLSNLIGSVPKFVGRSRFDLLIELTDAEELALGIEPHKADTDGDGIPDGVEVANGTNPNEAENSGNVGGSAPVAHDDHYFMEVNGILNVKASFPDSMK